MRVLHCSSTKRNNIKRRVIRAIYYWYNTRSSGRIIWRLAATPAATWPARTQHNVYDSPTAHTQPTAARMKPTARHHEYRLTATAGLLALWQTGAPALELGQDVCLVCCLVSVDEGTPLQ